MEQYAFNEDQPESPKDKLFREATETFYEILPGAKGELPNPVSAVAEDGEEIHLIASIGKTDRVRLSLRAATGDGSILPSLFDHFLQKGIRIHKLECINADEEMQRCFAEYPEKHQLL